MFDKSTREQEKCANHADDGIEALRELTLHLTGAPPGMEAKAVGNPLLRSNGVLRTFELFKNDRLRIIRIIAKEGSSLDRKKQHHLAFCLVESGSVEVHEIHATVKEKKYEKGGWFALDPGEVYQHKFEADSVMTLVIWGGGR